MEVRRPRALEAGLFLLVVALPLAFFPLSTNAFVDVKLVVLCLGTLLVWVSGLPVDRRLAIPAALWFAVLLVAALTGVDRAESLIGTLRGSGLVMLGCAAALVCIAPAVPDDLLARARSWLVWTGLVVAGLAVVARLAPEVLEPLASRLTFRGSTLGNPVFAVGFLAACVPAALATAREHTARTVAIFVLLGSGFAVAEERSAYLLPVAAIAAAWWFLRSDRRRVAVAAVVLAATIGAWAFVPALSGSTALNDRYRISGQFQTLVGERQRVAVYGANLRAVSDRPLLGWGPANGWSGFVSSATPEQIRTAGRTWADAHNLLLELTVVSGLLGLAAFGWLAVRIAPRAARPVSTRAWVAASAAVLLLYAMFEPLDVTLTPLLLLFAGIAAGGRRPDDAEDRRPGRAHAAAVALLTATALLATVNLAASGLEQWGRTHFEGDWALRRARTLAPWRITASEALALYVAVDGRAGDEAAAAEAREVVAAMVRAHPRNPGVRLLAADVELLLRNFPATQEWIREHLQVFPSDDIEVPAEEPEFEIPG